MWDRQAIEKLLGQVADGALSADAATQRLCALPYEALKCATLDHHRALRDNMPEVIFCQGKTPQQVAQIAQRLSQQHPRLLGTRATAEQYEQARKQVPELQYDAHARAIWLDRNAERKLLSGVTVVAAGTADLPVAQEAALTLRLMGCEPQQITDVGVAGLHRLLPHVKPLQSANVIICIAGMEGALPSVIGGMVRCPVIAVPTSVGYGASFGGVAALLGMLNSCAAGVAVVNIDNGYGAGHMAAIINEAICRAGQR